MLQKAKEHVKLAGFNNVDVLESSFDDIDIEDNLLDNGYKNILLLDTSITSLEIIKKRLDTI